MRAGMRSDRVRTILLIVLLVALFPGALAGCGGGGGSPGDPNSPIKLQAVSGGSLAVTIGNLPAGAVAAVHVSGPGNGAGNFSADLTASQTLDNLTPGNYTITAQPVVAGTTTWFPSPATQSVAVADGATAAASVNYALPPPV